MPALLASSRMCRLLALMTPLMFWVLLPPVVPLLVVSAGVVG